MTTILITGAGGFIGRHLARRLSAAGHRVTGVGRNAVDSEFCNRWGISHWIQADLSREFSPRQDLQVDAIVHCAGGSEVGLSEKEPSQDFRDTVVSLESMLEYCRRKDKSCSFLYLSSAAVYGAAARMPILETDDIEPVSVYGVHKAVSEQLVQSRASRYGLQAGIIRLFSVYGSGLRKQIFWDACCKASADNNRFFGTGQETRDFLHIDDATSLIEQALRHIGKSCLIVNGGSGEATSIAMLVTAIFRALKSESDPQFALESRSGDPQHYVADIAAAGRLGWQPQQSLENGIRAYVEWFRGVERTRKMQS